MTASRLPDLVRPRRRRTSWRGYTAIEVLIAMTVMAIGAGAVMTMQKASIQGNLEARKLDVATAIARMWQERLQADAMIWTEPNTYNSANNVANAALINDGLTQGGQWFVPGDHIARTPGPPESYAFDILGRDLPVAQLSSAVFCVAVSITPLVAPPGNAPQLLRADVRVMWLRGLGDNPTQASFCPAQGTVGTASDVTTPIPNPNVYHSLYATTALRENVPQ
jgi:prepilin-type N-terminal cleavage/methylation domain-containing protein